MRSESFEGIISNGRLPVAVSQRIAGLMRRAEGKRISVTLSEKRKPRSPQQNRFYFGVMLPLIYDMYVDAGNDMTEKELHEHLKEHVGKLMRTVHDPDGEIYEVVRSSAELTTVEWEEYMEKLRAWAAPFGLQLPFPKEGTPS